MMIKKINISLFIIIIAGIAFYLQDQFAILTNDDYFFSFIFSKWKPILSIRDAIASQCDFYFQYNGRFIIHTIVQYCCGVVGMDRFVVANSIVFCVFLFLFCKLCGCDKKAVLKYLVCIFCLWFLMPVLGMTFLGNIACSVNYLWAGTANLFFYYVYERTSVNNNKCIWYNIAVCLLGIVCGSLSESFSIGLSGALFLYYCFNYRNLNKSLIFLIMGYFVGTAVCVFAPGNFVRASGQYGIHYLFLYESITSPAVFVLVLTLIIYALKYKKRIKGILLEKNKVLFLAIIINGIFALFIGYSGRWQLTCIALFCLIITLRIWFEANWFSKIERFRISVVVIILLIGLSYGFVFVLRRDLCKSHQVFVQSAQQTKSGIVSCEEYAKLCNISTVIDSYVRKERYIGSAYNKEGLSMYITRGMNPALIKTVLPVSQKKVLECCNKENKVSENLYKLSEMYYVLCTNDLYPMENIKLQITYKRILFGSNGEIICNPCEYFSYNSKNYYLVFCNFPVVAIQVLL